MAGNPNSVSGRRTRSSYQYTMLNCGHHLDRSLKAKLALGGVTFSGMRGNEKAVGGTGKFGSVVFRFALRSIQGPDLQEY